MSTKYLKCPCHAKSKMRKPLRTSPIWVCLRCGRGRIHLARHYSKDYWIPKEKVPVALAYGTFQNAQRYEET